MEEIEKIKIRLRIAELEIKKLQISYMFACKEVIDATDKELEMLSKLLKK